MYLMLLVIAGGCRLADKLIIEIDASKVYTRAMFEKFGRQGDTEWKG